MNVRTADVLEAPVFVFFFCKLESSKDSQIETEKDLLRISAMSVRTSNSRSQIWILTNPEFIADLEALGIYDRVLTIDGVSKSNLDYMRVISQRDLVAALLEEGLINSIIFIDHDTLVSTELSFLFSSDFHFAAGCNFSTEYSFDQYMLPTNTGIASINAGVQLVNVSSEALDLLNRKVSLCRWIDKFKEKLSLPLSSSPLAWGCDQASMMLLFNREAFINANDTFKLDNARVRLFSTNIINYSPDHGSTIRPSEFYDHWIWHFKGNRRYYMNAYWSIICSRRA